jgi:hypothetical protein
MPLISLDEEGDGFRLLIGFGRGYAPVKSLCVEI